MSQGFTKEQLLMHGIWRKAAREGKLELTLPTKADAVRLRFGLYNSVRAVREGKVLDEELRTAAEDCMISLVDDVKVVVQLKARTAFMQAIAGALGDDLEQALAASAPVSADSAQEASELAAMQERLAKEFGQTDQEQSAPRSTPYYTREK